MVTDIVVEEMPTLPEGINMRDGVLYYSRRYRVAIHLCACGCGNETVTPISADGWNLNIYGGRPTMTPSILNKPCNSHYHITNGKVEWS